VSRDERERLRDILEALEAIWLTPSAAHSGTIGVPGAGRATTLVPITTA
jgi:hypothetical protein